MNGEEVNFGEAQRASFALGLGLRAVNFFLTAFLLFHGAGLLVGDAEGGRAAFDLTAPVSRAGYLAGRAAGVLFILALFWGAAILLFEVLLLLRFGGLRPGLLAGLPLLLLGQALFAGLLAMLRLYLGGGWGAMGSLLVWLASGVLSLDLIESSLFAVTVPEGTNPWWLPMIRPILGGEPIGPAAEAARAVLRFFPPIANVESVGIDLALARPVFPSLDWWSVPVAAAWASAIWWVVFRMFARRDW
jgi:ABC-type transport system involved in multi-copper enzyme maturation permease subunit